MWQRSYALALNCVLTYFPSLSLPGHSSALLAAHGDAGRPELGAHARGPCARDGLQRRPAGAVVADQRRAVSLIVWQLVFKRICES